MKMTTSTRQVGGVTIVDISGRIELGEESGAVRDMVRDLLGKGQKQILLNLGDVHYIDSTGLGALVSSFTSARKQGGELKLNLTDKVTDLMQMTKLYTVFDIQNDEAVAVKSFGQSTAATAGLAKRGWFAVKHAAGAVSDAKRIVDRVEKSPKHGCFTPSH
jgi:anti-sigma B factor antagonist